MCADHRRISNERKWVHTTESVRDSYFERGLTGDHCWLCGGEITETDPLNHDHLHPRSVGGPNELWNFAPAHRSCNVRRRNLPLDATLKAFPNYLPAALTAVPADFTVVAQPLVVTNADD
jgi:5-methylcytosine-specific restriction endonuclease McrA